MATHAQSVIDTTARRWVARSDAGLSSADAARLAVWREADPRHAAAFERYATAWKALAVPRQSGQGEALRSELDRQLRHDRRRRWVAGAASAFLLTLLGTLGWRSWMRPSHDLANGAVSVSAPLRQLLRDGSQVIAAPGSEWSEEFSEQERRVRLVRGQVHFQVAHDAQRPFIVSVEQLEFRAVGTAFALHTGPRIELVVTEGRVAVSPPIGPAHSVAAPGAETALIVAAGQSVRLDPDKPAPVVTDLAPDLIAEHMAWSHTTVEFSGAALPEVVAELNRHNAVRFVVADPSLRTVTLTGRFRADDPETFALLLRSGFGIAAERYGDELRLRPVITGK